MNLRRSAITVLLLLVAVHGALGAGHYIRTSDRKALVWNNNPQPRDEATWSGDVDSNGYATGKGTLTWFEAHALSFTGTNIPLFKPKMLSRYTGRMTKGKFEGRVVGVDVDGKTYHGTFKNGRKTEDWAAGEATEKEKKTSVAAATPAKKATPPAAASPATAAAKPTPKPAVPPAAPASTPVAESDQNDSAVSALAVPPSSLRATTFPRDDAATPAPKSGPGLTTGEAIEIADVEAKAQGVDLGQVRRPQAQYISSDDAWVVTYEPKAPDAKPVTVSVDDKAKKATVRGR